MMVKCLELLHRFITSTVAAVAAWVRPKRSGPPGPGRTPMSSRQLSRQLWEPRREPCNRTSTQQLPPTTTMTRCRTDQGYGLPCGRDKKGGNQTTQNQVPFIITLNKLNSNRTKSCFFGGGSVIVLNSDTDTQKLFLKKSLMLPNLSWQMSVAVQGRHITQLIPPP